MEYLTAPEAGRVLGVGADTIKSITRKDYYRVTNYPQVISGLSVSR